MTRQLRGRICRDIFVFLTVCPQPTRGHGATAGRQPPHQGEDRRQPGPRRLSCPGFEVSHKIKWFRFGPKVPIAARRRRVSQALLLATQVTSRRDRKLIDTDFKCALRCSGSTTSHHRQSSQMHGKAASPIRHIHPQRQKRSNRKAISNMCLPKHTRHQFVSASAPAAVGDWPLQCRNACGISDRIGVGGRDIER